MGLELPPDTVVLQARGASPAENRNLIVRKALELEADWIFWLDDDLVFSPNVLARLLQHDVPIVCGLSLRRLPPHEPLWWTRCDDNGQPVFASPDQWKYDHGSGKLVTLAGCTSGCLLTKTDVFKRTAWPWWTIGNVDPTTWMDDVWMCMKMQEHSIPIYGDPQVKCGHITSFEVWPHQSNGQWNVVFAKNNKASVSMAMKQGEGSV